MKTKLMIEIGVEYPTIENEAVRHSNELRETRVALDLVIAELKEAFWTSKKQEFKTIGNAEVAYDYTCDFDFKCPKCGATSPMTKKPDGSRHCFACGYSPS